MSQSRSIEEQLSRPKKFSSAQWEEYQQLKRKHRAALKSIAAARVLCSPSDTAAAAAARQPALAQNSNSGSVQYY
jgi:hypothetical protein